MQKEMNKTIFEDHLMKAVAVLVKKLNINGENYKFHITPVHEKNKPLFAEDEFMRLNVLNPNHIKDKFFTCKEIVIMLASFSPFVPIWINVSYMFSKQDTVFINLDCSLRLRKPSLLRNQETGYAPFKVII